MKEITARLLPFSRETEIYHLRYFSEFATLYRMKKYGMYTNMLLIVHWCSGMRVFSVTTIKRLDRWIARSAERATQDSTALTHMGHALILPRYIHVEMSLT